MSETIRDFRFSPPLLQAGSRPKGVSAFMRVRNGAFSLEETIRSHIGHFDEIVALYNRCTDDTPAILGRLAQEFGPRLRVYHYLPPVFPPGSDGHRSEPAGSPRSLVTYYNCALSLTRFSHATKLDDDHLAIEPALRTLLADVRAGNVAARDIACYSGLNLARDATGELGILARDPFSGSGDISIFPVGPTTYFVHDRRFEKFQHPGLPARFQGFTYWHLKYLKPDLGFANYDLADNPRSRYRRRHQALERDRAVLLPAALVARLAPGLERARALLQSGLPLTGRYRVTAARDLAFARSVSDGSLGADWQAMVEGGALDRLGGGDSEAKAVA